MSVVRTAVHTVLAGTLVLALAASADAQALNAQVENGARLLPGTPPDVLATIEGNVLDSTGRPMTHVRLRLRDARRGPIVATTTTDDAGLFAFRSLDPGSYIVELVSDDATVMASSQLLYIDAGDVVSAVVKLPFKVAPFGGLLGHSLPSALAVAAAAASAGVLAATVSGDPQSP
jgi:hypothetical protein